jgi:Tol biopolymer transport system component
MTRDLLQICFSSNRPGGVGLDDIWCARRSSASEPFETPHLEAAVSSSGYEWDPELSADGQELFFTSDRAGSHGLDLYRSTWSATQGAFMAPTALGTLNSDGIDGGPALSGDGLTLYFNSDRVGGTGRQDLYRATRPTRDAAFGAPVRVAELASPAYDTGAALSPDGAFLVFCRQADDHASPGMFSATRSNDGSWSNIAPVSIVLPPQGAACDPELLSDGSLLFGMNDDLYVAPPMQ